MPDRAIKDTKRGDRVRLQDGSVGVIVEVKPMPIVDAAPRLGGAFEVKWTDAEGESGHAVVTGLAQIEVVE
jgi:hypothetical protein